MITDQDMDPLAIPAIRKCLRHMPDLIDYGVVSSGSASYGQSDFNRVITGMAADGLTNIYAPAGNYRLSEQIQLDYPLFIEGDTKSSTVFKMVHANSGFVATGINGTGGGLRDLSVVNDSGGLCTAYIRLIAALAGHAPDFFVIERVNCTGFDDAQAQYGIILDGNARTGVAANCLIGLRNIRVRDTDVFNCTVLNLDVRAGHGITLDGLKHYQARGTVTKASFSGVSAAQKTYSVQIIGCSLGDVGVDRAEKIVGLSNEMNNVTVSANALNSVLGTAFGSVTNAGIGTKVLKSNGAFV